MTHSLPLYLSVLYIASCFCSSIAFSTNLADCDGNKSENATVGKLGILSIKCVNINENATIKVSKCPDDADQLHLIEHKGLGTKEDKRFKLHRETLSATFTILEVQTSDKGNYCWDVYANRGFDDVKTMLNVIAIEDETNIADDTNVKESHSDNKENDRNEIGKILCITTVVLAAVLALALYVIKRKRKSNQMQLNETQQQILIVERGGDATN
ncbi:uncharacterized protein O3C94_012969 isoform 1-T3 [Discoglossus pictus]